MTTDRHPQRTPEATRRAAAIAALVAIAALASTGCTVCQNVRRTMIGEPFAFSWKFDRGRSLRTYSLWADQAWREYSGTCEETPCDDFGSGFRDGFVDYVYAGGNGEPPPVPPHDYWNVVLRSPEGHERANQWFAGYRQGVAVARAGGYREEATVHTAMQAGAYGEFAGEAPPYGSPADALGGEAAEPVLPGVPELDSKGELPALDGAMEEPPAPESDEIPADELEKDPGELDSLLEIPSAELPSNEPRGEESKTEKAEQKAEVDKLKADEKEAEKEELVPGAPAGSLSEPPAEGENAEGDPFGASTPLGSIHETVQLTNANAPNVDTGSARAAVPTYLAAFSGPDLSTASAVETAAPPATPIHKSVVSDLVVALGEDAAKPSAKPLSAAVKLAPSRTGSPTEIASPASRHGRSVAAAYVEALRTADRRAPEPPSLNSALDLSR